MFDDEDQELIESSRRLENAATDMVNALREDGLIPGGSRLYHPDDEPEYVDDDPNQYGDRDPDDPQNRAYSAQSDHIAPGARME